MREIKFRAWDRVNQKLKNNIHLATHFEEYLQLQQFVVMQYTGLKDKNGKEIYESDRVRIGDKTFVVRYEVIKARFWFFTTLAESSDNYFAGSNVSSREELHWFDCEVVGNEYES